jgi:hypothetical protein
LRNWSGSRSENFGETLDGSGLLFHAGHPDRSHGADRHQYRPFVEGAANMKNIALFATAMPISARAGSMPEIRQLPPARTKRLFPGIW